MNENVGPSMKFLKTCLRQLLFEELGLTKADLNKAVDTLLRGRIDTAVRSYLNNTISGNYGLNQKQTYHDKIMAEIPKAVKEVVADVIADVVRQKLNVSLYVAPVGEERSRSVDLDGTHP